MLFRSGDYSESNAEDIRHWSLEIKKFRPDDFIAEFCLTVYSAGKEKHKVREFLCKQCKDRTLSEITFVLHTMLHALEKDYMLPVSRLLEDYRNAGGALFDYFRKRYDEEKQRVDSGVYSLTLKRHVFVAYNREDIDRVLDIVSYLEERGLSCFVATRNLRQCDGAAYDKAIETAIDNCRVFLFVSSVRSRTECGAYREMQWVKAQDEKAFNLGEPAKARNARYVDVPRNYKKMRVEYQFDYYGRTFIDDFVKEFFYGLNPCTDLETLKKTLSSYLNDQKTWDSPVEQKTTPKQYCVSCLTEAPKTAKFCPQCGKTVFLSTYEEAKAKKDSQAAIEKAKQEAADQAKKAAEEQAQKTAEEKTKQAAEAAAKRKAEAQAAWARYQEVEQWAQLAEDYYYGKNGKAKDPDKAFENASKAAKAGNARGQYLLGWCYELGFGVKKSYESAIEWFTKLAEQGYARAQCHLGYCYEMGQGVEQSDKKAFEWYTKSAEQGEKIAQDNLGLCYEYARGVRRSYEKAVEWYTKSAMQGCARAQFNLGRCYECGNGVTKSISTAIEWYKKAASQGYENAEKQLDLLENIPESPQDFIKAIQEKTAKQEDTAKQKIKEETDKVLKEGWALFEKGNAEEQARAAALLRTPALDGNAFAQYLLGRCYYEGKGLSQSKNKASTWFEKSANQGYAPAQRDLGVCYLNGEGVLKDEVLGFRWISKAALQCDANAYYILACCYKKGVGCMPSFEYAADCFDFAAKRGHVAAMYELGVLYESGSGVEKSLTKAIEWYKKAAEKGSPFAKKRLKELKVE